MYRDNSSTNSDPATSPQNLYRGLYVRVARKLSVDPSYVSRVARGDRRSNEIENALRDALEEITQRLPAGENRASRSSGTPKRLTTLMEQNRNRLQKQWLAHSQTDSNLRKVRIPAQKRT